jgi:hypothetical protein
MQVEKYEQMVAQLTKPGADILASLTPEKTNFLHMALGLSGEGGELLEPALATLLGNGTNDVLGNLTEELGDAEFYLEGIRVAAGIDRGMTLPITAAGPLILWDYNGLAIAFGASAGTVLDVAKRHVVYNKELERDRLIIALSEIEMVMWGFRHHFGLKRDDILEANMVKLLSGKNARYAGGYSDEAAVARVDKE